MTLEVPLPEKISSNKGYAGVHWSVRQQQAEDYHFAVHIAARQASILPFSGEFPVNITYHFRLRGKSLDSSNLAYMTKLLEDGLTHAGIIPDDNPKYVRSTTMITDKGDDTCTIHISPSLSPTHYSEN